MAGVAGALVVLGLTCPCGTCRQRGLVICGAMLLERLCVVDVPARLRTGLLEKRPG